MRRYIVQFIRFIVGVLFIFSGYVKLNDPMGFGFKLEEYFSESVLNLPFFTPYVVGMAIAICIVEIVVGVALLLGLWKKLTMWTLLLMIVFFTFLTFYSAYFNVVTDCGCFGDAIPLTPYQSFGKDVILTVLILILFFNSDVIKPMLKKTYGVAVLGAVTLICLWNSNHVLNHLPRQDFRAYKIGTDIVHDMKHADELGLEAPVYETFFTFQNAAGELVEVSGTKYVEDKWYEKSDWTMLDSLSESRLVKEGYEPPIHDFVMESDTGDITSWVLEQPRMILVLSYLLEASDAEGMDALSAWAWSLDEEGFPILGWTNSNYDAIENARHQYSLPFDFVSGDGTTIKTVVRSNPGIVAVKNGVIVGKWHWNDRPSKAELDALFR